MRRLALLVVLASARVAAADEHADCNYLEIAATTGASPSVDPELQPLAKKLGKPPFASWSTFHKLSGGPVPLVKLKAVSLKLAQGAAQLLLRDRQADGKRLEITVQIDGADGKRVLDNKQSVDVGEWTVWGHSIAKDDGHILALTCK